MRSKFGLLVVFLVCVLTTAHYNRLDYEKCIPFGSACGDYGLAHFYSLFHFNGRYMGDERMRIPFSIALNAPILGAI